MSIKCNEVCRILEELSPTSNAYDWDNVGLLVGKRDNTVNNIMVALDATEDVITQAINNNIDLIITHHPLIFKGMKKITTDDFIGRKVINLIENRISLYSMHTNFDIVGGLGDIFAEKLNLISTEPLEKTKEDKLYKLVVFVPNEDSEKVRNAICEAGAGHIGNYSHCTYNIEGKGTFLPLDNTNPHIGRQGQLETVEETRIETIVSDDNLNTVVKAMLEAHPYEEVAYDIYELKIKGKAHGIGRIGILEDSMTLKDYANLIKNNLGLSDVRIYGDLDKQIKRVASCSGSGKSYVSNAIKQKADVLVTGDIDYHTGIDGIQQGIALIDVGHYGSEHIASQYIANYLREKLRNINIITAVENNPYIII